MVFMMNEKLKAAFENEMKLARDLYGSGHYSQCFVHLERGHILGQRFYIPHVRNHWWMLKVGWKRFDVREVVGQVFRIIASVGSLTGTLPIGNTGGANISPFKPMPIPEDLAVYFDE